MNCPAGTYGQREMLQREKQCRDCSIGHACPAGREKETGCPRGAFAASRRTTSCSVCPKGAFQDQPGQSACEVCTAGHFCSSGSVDPVPLLAETYSRRLGLHNTSQADVCPAGFYCTLGSTAPQPCAAGTAGQQPGLGAAAFCSKCAQPTTSLEGSHTCIDCEAGFYRLHRRSPAQDCTRCSEELGLVCQYNATVSSIELARGFWRHSNATMQTWPCKYSGNWTPCTGGAHTDGDGDGYCANGHLGPQCELCGGPKYTRYFDKLDVRCHECGDVTTKAT
eukprot:4591363-Prymnesium_polylepis.1